MRCLVGRLLVGVILFVAGASAVSAQSKPKSQKPNNIEKEVKQQDGRNRIINNEKPPHDPDLLQYGIYAKTAPRAKTTEAVVTELPLDLKPGAKIAFIGNGLLEQTQHFGYFETLLHQRYPEHHLIVRNLAWSADTPDLQPRPANFADVEQHLTHEKVDVIVASYGFNESFAGPPGLDAFRESLTKHVNALKTKAFNATSGPQIVLLSPIANENIPHVPAADLNNENLELYAQAVREVATATQVAYVDVFAETLKAMQPQDSALTLNGVHLNEQGQEAFARSLYRGLFNEEPSAINEDIRKTVVDKNTQYFRRYRPVNTFYYTGDRNKSYGYLDFLPAMKNFDIMVANREQRIWDLAAGKAVPEQIDDSNVPPLPKTIESRGANQWITAEEELKAFKIDPRFEVNLFAGEEEFADLGAPIQIRWDARGRLWVSCSTTYPHVYPGNEPNDKLVILEDTDGDGRADTSKVFADNLHIPLSFEFGDGGVYVSEQPHLTFLKDEDGDDKADTHVRLLTGFGTEDSHHSLHDFTWTPDGDLLFRESIFHHSQVETPYGPVRQQNSGWFKYEPKTMRLTSFGTYHSTNPWGVTFDDWGNHMASHPVFAAAFHALDPPYPQQHPKPAGLQAYSGTCGQEFVDFATFPEELQGGFIKVRYKPTNRVEIHRWIENEFGYEEEYVSDLIFSTNLSFIPVDLQWGPRGALYLCDWYNPVKGHAQYSLRDERRDRHSGRIWRITTKGKPVQAPPKVAEATIAELLENLKRPEYRVRFWSKRELHERDHVAVKQALDRWVSRLDPADSRHRHHQIEALWTYRWIDAINAELLREVIDCEEHHARAAATQQLRCWHDQLPDAIELLKKSANDPKGLVRLEAAMAATYIGTQQAFDALLQVTNYPAEKHLAYAVQCALGAKTMVPFHDSNPAVNVKAILRKLRQSSAIKEPTPSATEAQFDSQEHLKTVKISCLPERMRYTVTEFTAICGQPVKLVFMNPDATDHNLVIVKPDSLAEVGMAANLMAKDPKFANSDFIPEEKKSLILHASPLIGPTRKSQVHVLRFQAPTEPGIYPYVCTFPGHWVIMKGDMVVANTPEEAQELLAARTSTFVQEWTLEDFAGMQLKFDEETLQRGAAAFAKGRCNQCHVVRGRGVNLGPELTEISKRFKGEQLLTQMLMPSKEINKKYQNYQFLLKNGKVVTGVIVKETEAEYHVAANLLAPDLVQKVIKSQVEEQIASKLSPMPQGLLNMLEKQEIIDMVSYLQGTK